MNTGQQVLIDERDYYRSRFRHGKRQRRELRERLAALVQQSNSRQLKIESLITERNKAQKELSALRTRYHKMFHSHDCGCKEGE